MASDPELVRLYLNRLVGSLAPAELNTNHAQALVNDLTAHITHQASFLATSVQPLPQVLSDFKTLFYKQNRQHDWSSFQNLVGSLISETSPEEFTRHLVHLSRLANSDHGPRLSQIQGLQHSGSSDPFVHVSSPFSSSPREHASVTKPCTSELMRPYYRTHDEAEIINALRHTLVGHDTKLLPFSPDGQGVEIPETVNTAYTQLLSDILEPALLFVRLHLFLETHRSKRTSPIKMAFFSFADACLVRYADYVEGVFRSTPVSLIALLDSLDDQIHLLRFLGHLEKPSVESNGFEFLQEVYKFSHFGDPRVSEWASELFKGISAPYFQYLEHWLIKGELIDEHDEFFVSFDNTENHINDIIQFHHKKLPSFLKLDEEVLSKVYQLGKTLVFLEKYCKEFDWVNDFASRYYYFIFTTHSGVHSMDSNTLQEMIERQYQEVIKFNMSVIQSKFSLFSHLQSMKKIMLMESGDFIDVTIQEGATVFNKPADSLNSAQLSELLLDSIELSSLRYLHSNYQKRVDARILDLSHGTGGWDVFTLAYSLPEPPLDAILNYNNQSTQYLRLFNFLWGLKHYQYLLRESFARFQDYHRKDLRLVNERHKHSKGPAAKLTEKRLRWLARALRVISLVRHKLSVLVDSLLRFVSFDLIEDNFNKYVVHRLFKKSAAPFWELKKSNSNEAPRLSILDNTFLGGLGGNSRTFAPCNSAQIDQNCAELTIDDLTDMHAQYLRSVSECKLLREDVVGKHTKKSFVRQIFEFLELTFAYLGSCQEFGTILSAYVNLLLVKSSSHDLDEDWDDLHRRLVSIKTFIQKDIYTDKFEPWLKDFTQDLRAEADLKELGKLI